MPNRSAPGAERPFSDDELRSLFAPVAEAAHVALAVSGGSDSTALLALAARWARLASAPPRISVLTVDHGLRPEAAGEAATVARWAAGEGFAHHTLLWDGTKPKTGIQAAARAARYRLMTAWCRAYDAQWLLTAHTQDDQAETVLMRLARGTGVDGLAGIWRRVDDDGISILRPFLDETRARLRATLAADGRRWIDDPSNSMPQFERVRLRQSMPKLAALGLTSQALAKTAARALDAYHALWTNAGDFAKTSVRHHDEGYAEVELAPFLALPDEIKRRVILLLVERYGGRRSEPVSLSGAERLVHVERWRQPARTFGGCKIVRRQRTLLVGRESGRIDPQPVTIPADGEVLWDGRFLVTAPPGNKIVPLGVLTGIEREPSLPKFVQDGLPAILDDARSVLVPHLHHVVGVSVVFTPPRVR